MITGAYAIFDVKSDTFSVPFFCVSNGVALRNFADLANDGNTTVGRHPEDFKLLKVGTFNDSNGELMPSGMESLGFASEYVKPEEVGRGALRAS